MERIDYNWIREERKMSKFLKKYVIGVLCMVAILSASTSLFLVNEYEFVEDRNN